MRRRALGKGLSALLPEAEAVAGAQEAPIGRLEPNPQQPRTHIGPAQLEELAASLKESGMLQAILVRPHGSGYQIIAGERRWRAAQKAGLATVPIRVRAVKDEQMLELALVENIQREELQPLEEAHAYQRLQQELGLTQEQLAQRVGRERSTVANSLRLLRAPREVRNLLTEGKLEAGHVRALLSLDRADQLQLAREAARQGASVRELERRASRLKSPPKQRPAARKDANTRAAEQRLKMALGSTVEIARAGEAGTIRIAFRDEKDLNRLFELLVKRRGRG